MIAIPSKNRRKAVETMLNTWGRQMSDEGIDIFVFIEREDTGQEIDCPECPFLIVTLNEVSKGIGYARREAVSYAHNNGYEKILFLDDNCKFSKTEPPMFGKFMELVSVESPFVAGWNNIYKKFGSLQGACFGLYTQSVIDVGNYDENMTYCEDKLLLLNLIAKFGKMAYKCSDYIVFDIKRHQQGGTMSFKNLDSFHNLIDYIKNTYPKVFRIIKIKSTETFNLRKGEVSIIHSMDMHPTKPTRKTKIPDFQRNPEPKTAL